MKRLLILFFFLPVLGVSAQYKVRFILKKTAPIKRDRIFIAGTFDNWESLQKVLDKIFQPFFTTKLSNRNRAGPIAQL